MKTGGGKTVRSIRQSNLFGTSLGVRTQRCVGLLSVGVVVYHRGKVIFRGKRRSLLPSGNGGCLVPGTKRRPQPLNRPFRHRTKREFCQETLSGIVVLSGLPHNSVFSEFFSLKIRMKR